MFTGIVNEIGNIVSIEKKKKNNIFTVKLSSIALEGLQIGASVAHNGCCLTVTYVDDHTIICNAVEETLKHTNLGTLSIGDYINIERSVKYGEEIGGHIISGHIIDTIKIFKIKKNHDNYILWLQVQNMKLMKYIFYKGFVCLDGISLTVSNVINDKFCVNIIPHTLLSTTIQYKKNGDSMNIEIDFYTQTIVDTTERFLDRNMKSFL